jgi:hypothetical protein
MPMFMDDNTRPYILLPEGCAIINDLDVIFAWVQVIKIIYTTVFGLNG